MSRPNTRFGRLRDDFMWPIAAGSMYLMSPWYRGSVKRLLIVGLEAEQDKNWSTMTQEKLCPKCGQTLPASKFSKNNATEDGYVIYCKECIWPTKPKPNVVPERPKYIPFDQDEHLPRLTEVDRWGAGAWVSAKSPGLKEWEQGHSRDVRLPSYADNGCQVIEPYAYWRGYRDAMNGAEYDPDSE